VLFCMVAFAESCCCPASHELEKSPSSLQNYKEAHIIPRSVPPQFHWFFHELRSYIPTNFFPSSFPSSPSPSPSSSFARSLLSICKTFEGEAELFLSSRLTTLISDDLLLDERFSALGLRVTHQCPLYYRDSPNRRKCGKVDVAVEICGSEDDMKEGKYPNCLLSYAEVKIDELDDEAIEKAQCQTNTPTQADMQNNNTSKNIPVKEDRI